MNIEALLSLTNTYLISPISSMILLIAGVVLSVRLRFFQFSNPVKLWRLMSDKKAGGTSPFRALTVALAGTLGVGNISGVAIALSLGGAGAVFWMWISAGCAMIVKYSEIVLAVYHRDETNCEVHGGAMYYIKYGLKKHGFASYLAGAFAAFCIFSSLSTGSVIQVNAVSEAFYGCFGISHSTVGILMALLCALALFSQKKNAISDITVRLVPIMSLLFIVLSLWIIISKIEMLPEIIRIIFEDAFTTDSAIGGIGGYVFSRGVRFGVTKGLFSNEAGCGTSTIAHAQANSSSPKSQGVWGIFEVFFDTVVLCTLTAFVLLISYGNAVPDEGGGVMVALSAYGTAIGNEAKYALALAIFMFAYATIICWAYYGCECIRFLFKSRYPKYIYLCIYVMSVLYGAVAASSFLWEIADLTICIMMSVNTLCVCAMSDTVCNLHINKGEA